MAGVEPAATPSVHPAAIECVAGKACSFALKGPTIRRQKLALLAGVEPASLALQAVTKPLQPASRDGWSRTNDNATPSARRSEQGAGCGACHSGATPNVRLS